MYNGTLSNGRVKHIGKVMWQGCTMNIENFSFAGHNISASHCPDHVITHICRYVTVTRYMIWKLQKRTPKMRVQ